MPLSPSSIMKTFETPITAIAIIRIATTADFILVFMRPPFVVSGELVYMGIKYGFFSICTSDFHGKSSPVLEGKGENREESPPKQG
jgi:hypothetical protein